MCVCGCEGVRDRADQRRVLAKPCFQDFDRYIFTETGRQPNLNLLGRLGSV